MRVCLQYCLDSTGTAARSTAEPAPISVCTQDAGGGGEGGEGKGVAEGEAGGRGFTWAGVGFHHM